MIKVSVRRAGTGIAAASSLLVAAGAPMGCTFEAQDAGEDFSAEAEQALTPGSGTLALDGWTGSLRVMLSASTTDEFLRAGEILQMELPAWLLWDTLYPGTALPNDLARLQKLSATVNVAVVDKGTTVSTLKLPVASFSGADPYALDAITKSFIVPAKADWLKFEILVTDAAAPGVSKTIGQNELTTLPVFGGDLPDKSLLFDSVQTTKRQRVIEGDDPIAGAKLDVGYSDWRADVLVDKSAIDLQIGKAQTVTRFGFAIVPIYGKLVHEVSYGVYFDDGGGWRPEVALTPNGASRFLGANRTAYEGTIDVPAKARRMAMYAHVKSYLVADYTGIQSITEKWYQDGQKVQKAEAYDNPSGAFTNYDFSVSGP
ncbi:hypothetical protein [Polyangium aurulentum]|uniref:hypothetical protein n=1 Tax=Polyangium aurulentum TaxID=2567896 RepID=UPI0010ADE957|nr:hypothetical protein [Polyangium aurulentum]UQA62263.1 hypothetical protein E8A73_018035 [Polyangium aurulentum]